ncbi:MAG: DUF1648 domain-containing protein, partial [Bacteroidota bacterium]
MIFNGGTFGLFGKNRVEANRPVSRPEMTPADWLIEAAALLGMMFFAGYVLYNFPHLPDRIPTHFNEAGKADDYGDKSSFLILPGVALFIYTLLTLINRVPHIFNLPVKITPANALHQYTIATRLIRTLKTAIVWLFWYISYSTIIVARDSSKGLGTWFLPLTLSLVFIPIIVYFIAAKRRG